MLPLDLLMGTVLSEGLSREQVETLATLGTEKHASDQETVVDRSDTTFPLLVILKGECLVIGVMGDVVNDLKQGMLVGEVSFLDRQPRSARAVAKGDSTFGVFEEDFLERLGEKSPEIEAQVLLNVSKVLCRKLRVATRAIDASLA